MPCKPQALRAAGCRRIFEEAASGGRWDRPELHRLLDQLREGDVVVVWKLDRLSRSLKDVLHIMERIGDAGAGFRSITEAIDTTTPAGRMMMQMVGSFAEFERAMIRERTSAGLAAARAEGRIGGRRKKLDAGQAPRNRRKRPLRPQDRRRDGAALQRQRSRLCHASSPRTGSDRLRMRFLNNSSLEGLRVRQRNRPSFRAFAKASGQYGMRAVCFSPCIFEGRWAQSRPYPRVTLAYSTEPT